MQHQPYASSAVGSSDALLRATAGSSGLSRRAVLRFGALFSAGLALSACSGQSSAGSSTGSSASASASSADARRVFRFAQGAAAGFGSGVVSCGEYVSGDGAGFADVVGGESLHG